MTAAVVFGLILALLAAELITRLAVPVFPGAVKLDANGHRLAIGYQWPLSLRADFD